ncbi:MAG: MBL fold metallo-hydrolase [Luminiphilus sp.]|jgi:cyclase|nr:MBL fold metallo-hydrolase [Luminiphilus sp.]
MKITKLGPISFILLTFSLLQAQGLLAHQHAPTVDRGALLKGFGWDAASAEITSQKVADGLYVLFGLGGNIAVSIGTDGVLIVDDQLPELKDKIKAAIGKLGGDDIDYVVNTHWHFDHADGNTALGPDGATILAHSNARADMADGGMIDMVVTQYWQKPYPAAALPRMTYTQEMSLHFNGGTIELRHFSPAHTNGDTAVFFHDQNAVHLGDVFNNSGYPFIDVSSGGTVDGMINFCDVALEAINEKTIVIPGHGPVTDYQTFKRYVAMLRSVRDRIQMMIDEGKTLDEVSAAKPTADFDTVYGPETASLGFVNRVYTDLTHGTQHGE